VKATFGAIFAVVRACRWFFSLGRNCVEIVDAHSRGSHFVWEKLRAEPGKLWAPQCDLLIIFKHVLKRFRESYETSLKNSTWPKLFKKERKKKKKERKKERDRREWHDQKESKWDQEKLKIFFLCLEFTTDSFVPSSKSDERGFGSAILWHHYLGVLATE